MSEEAAYFSGLFDGEGCVKIQQSKNYRSHQLQVAIRMCDGEPLFALWKSFGGYFTQHPSKGVRRIVFDWGATGKEALRFLAWIEPYSMAKSRQIQVALQFYIPDGKPYGRNPVPEDVRLKRQSLREQLIAIRREGAVTQRNYWPVTIVAIQEGGCRMIWSAK
jgi:hypothetical protein